MLAFKIERKKTISLALVFVAALILSGCGKSGSRVDRATNLTGEWVGTGFINGGSAPTNLRMTITQALVNGEGISSASGNVLIDGICVFVFNGATVNSTRKTFEFNQNNVALNATFTLTSITGAIASTNDASDGDGCGIFRADVRFNRR